MSIFEVRSAHLELRIKGHFSLKGRVSQGSYSLRIGSLVCGPFHVRELHVNSPVPQRVLAATAPLGKLPLSDLMIQGLLTPGGAILLEQQSHNALTDDIRFLEISNMSTSLFISLAGVCSGSRSQQRTIWKVMIAGQEIGSISIYEPSLSSGAREFIVTEYGMEVREIIAALESERPCTLLAE